MSKFFLDTITSTFVSTVGNFAPIFETTEVSYRLTDVQLFALLQLQEILHVMSGECIACSRIRQLVWSVSSVLQLFYLSFVMNLFFVPLVLLFFFLRENKNIF